MHKDFIKKVFITITTEGGLFILAIMSSIILARWLGPAGRGEFALITTSITLLMAFGLVGLPYAVVYYNRRLPESELKINALLLTLGLSFCWLIFGFMLLPRINELFLHINQNMLYLGIIALPILFVGQTASYLIQGDYQLERFNLIRLIPPIGFILLFILLLFLSEDLLKVAFFSWIVSNTLFVWMAVWSTLKQTRFEFRHLIPKLHIWRLLLNFGLRSHWGYILKQLQYRLDLLIVGMLLDAKHAGYYAVALGLAEIIWKVPNSIGLVLLPRIARDEDRNGSRYLTPIVNRNTLFITIASTLAFIPIAYPIIILFYGMDFSPIYTPFLLLLPGVVLLSVWKILANDMIGQGYPNLFSLSALCSVVILVVSDLILIPLYNLNGAAVGCSLSYFTATCILFISYIRVTGNRIRDCLILTRHDLQSYQYYWKNVSSQIKQRFNHALGL